MNDDVGVVISGIGGQFPQCDNFEKFASSVLANENLVTYSDVWEKEAVGIEPWVGQADFKPFDHAFFGIHKSVALWTDPTHRAGFQRAFEAIVDAGIHPASLRGSGTQVCYGSFGNDDFTPLYCHHAACAGGYSIMGHNVAMAANRISYVFDFRGESLSLGCSASLHLGLRLITEAIKSSVCDSALLVVSNGVEFPHMVQELNNLGLISADGITRSFDVYGTGSARSSGTVALFLQRADQAKRCYARVLAADSEYVSPRMRLDPTLPSPAGFEAFLSGLYRRSRLDPAHVVYVEADGSGWPLQDEAELAALAGALRGRNQRRNQGRERPLQVGSAKSNAGNAEAAAAALSLCRAVVAMETGVIPATINCKQPLAVRDSDVQVVTENSPLQLDSNTTLAINSIGITGEMGHTILKPCLKEKVRCDPPEKLPWLVTIASRTEAAAHQVTKKIQSYPFDPEYLRLVQDVFSPNLRGYEFRSFCICPPLPDEAAPEVARVEKRALWYVYSGMGSQWAGMGAGLMDLPIFRDTIERLHAVLEPRGVNLKQVITETGPGAFDNILKSFVGITACQIGLTNVLSAMALRPAGIIGHSVGELGCAYADGCLTEEQTILAAWARGVASNRATLIKGMMAAVGLGYQEIIGLLPSSIEVACRNSSTSSTISGPAEDVLKFVKELAEKGIFARAVNVSDIAYHSRYIQPAAPYLREFLEAVIPHPRKRSSRWVSTSVPQQRWDQPSAQYCSAEYLTNNLLSAVLFEDGIRFIPQHALLVELAPHGLLQSILKREQPENVHVALCQRGSGHPVRTLLNAIGRMSLGGANPMVSALYPEVRFPVSRGTPPLSPLVHWYLEESVTYSTRKHRISNYLTRTLVIDAPHMKLSGVHVLALSEMLEIVCDCLARINHMNIHSTKVIFNDIHVSSYEAFLPDGDATTVTASLNPASGRFEVFMEKENTEDQEVRMLAWGFVRLRNDEDEDPKALPQPGTTDPECLSAQDILGDLASRGLIYSEKYRRLESIAVGEQDWLLHIQSGRSVASLLEAAIQAALLRHMVESEGLVLVRGIQRLELDAAQLLDREICAQYNVKAGVIQATGLYMMGVKTERPKMLRTLENAKQPANSYKFVAFGETNLQSLGEFLSLAAQLAEERDLRAVQLEDAGLGTVSSRMGIQVDVQLMDVQSPPPELQAEEARLWLSGPRTLQLAARLVARSGGLLLARCPSPARAAPLRVLAEQQLDGDWLSLLCRPEPLPADTLVVELGPRDPLPARVSAPAVLVWRGQPAGGVASAVEEVQRRRYAKLCRLVFILDEAAPPFSLSEPLYAEQLQLQQPVSVLRRGRWGCWRALPLQERLPAALSARWTQDVRFSYLGLNPKHRTNVTDDPAWFGHLDYVGCTDRGQRVMGVAQWPSDRARPRLDPLLRWAVPESWTDEEAATVPFAYATAYHALCVRMAVQPGESVLILAGASAVGQAAIRVALQRRCSPILVTVSSEAQRELVRENFPQVGFTVLQLDQRHVLSCAQPAGFEWRVRLLTGDQGVGAVLSQEAPPGCGVQLLRAATRCVAKYGRLLHYGRDELLSGSSVGMWMFTRSTSMYGMTGDQLFTASPRDRAALAEAVQEGLRSGAVQPVIGAESSSGARIHTADDCPKTVLEVPTDDEVLGPQECDPKKSYVIVGGDQHEWLQVAGWLARQGAQGVLAVPGGKSGGALVRDRQRYLRQQLGASVRVHPVSSWDEAAAKEVVQAAAATSPIGAVIVLLKHQDDASLPALLHAALSEHPGAALAVLAERPQTARGLAALCEARRGAGLRAACVSGRLDAALGHLAALLSGARPPVTLVGEPDTAGSERGQDDEPLLASGVPSCAEALAALGRRLESLPQQGVRIRELRRAASARENPPVFHLPPLGVLDSTGNLSELAARLVSPLVCVEYRPAADLHQLALSIVQELTATWPTGPFNLLGLSMSNPLTLEVARCLEDIGHNVVTFLVDGDVLELKSWASSLSDTQLLRTALRNQDVAIEVLENAADSDSWAGLVSRVLPQPQCAALQAIRTAAQGIARHEPRVAQPVRCHLVAVRTRVSDCCCFNMADDNVEPMVMPQEEIQLALGSSWLASKLNENCAWSKLANQNVVHKMLLDL